MYNIAKLEDGWAVVKMVAGKSEVVSGLTGLDMDDADDVLNHMHRPEGETVH